MKNLVAVLSALFVGFMQISDFRTNENTSLTPTRIRLEIKEQENNLAVNKSLPCLGFCNTKANAMFLQFLQYFGDDEAREVSGYALSNNFFQSILRDDPYYTDFYVFMTSSVSLRAAMPEESVELMNLGLASLADERPEDSFYVWRYKAIDELLFLGDAEAAKSSFEMAAAWAKQSSLPESDLIASTSQQTANFLEQNPDSKSAQVSAWSSVLSSAIDDETRKRAINGIHALGGQIIVNNDGSITVRYARTEQDAES
ncbi:MAG: hypothetical protein AAFY54_08135 [Cyanobacteria bacterium J06648_10]